MIIRKSSFGGGVIINGGNGGVPVRPGNGYLPFSPNRAFVTPPRVSRHCLGVIKRVKKKMDAHDFH